MMMLEPVILAGHGHVFQPTFHPDLQGQWPACVNCGEVQHQMGNAGPCKLPGLNTEPVRGDEPDDCPF